LRNTVQWSYDLLDEEERVVLGCCSVFADGFDLAAASHLCADRLDEYDVLDRLDSLVRKSLVIAEPVTGHVRYGLLETIRQFAEEQLAATGSIDAVRDRHARYFADKADAILEVWASPQQRTAYQWIDTEFANLRSGFRWATGNDDLDSAASIAISTSIAGVWMQLYEQFAWAEELLDWAIRDGFRRLPSLYAAAAHCCLRGRVDDALTYGRAGVDLNDQPDYEPVPFAYGYLVLGAAYMYAGRLDKVVENAAACRQRSDDRLTTGPCQLAYGLAVTKRFEEAQTMAEEAVAATNARGIPSQIAYALVVYGGPSPRRTRPGRWQQCAEVSPWPATATTPGTRAPSEWNSPFWKPPTATPTPRSNRFITSLNPNSEPGLSSRSTTRSRTSPCSSIGSGVPNRPPPCAASCLRHHRRPSG
jgi:hypothetical protein